MQCEICGEDDTFVLPTIFEGNRVYACGKCIRGYGLTTIKPKGAKGVKTKPLRVRPTPRAKPPEDYVLVEGYGKVIKSAREARGLTQEALAGLLNEKASVVKKVESEKMSPSLNLIRKLEHVLKIKMTEKLDEDLATRGGDQGEGLTLTLGDVAVFKKEGGEQS